MAVTTITINPIEVPDEVMTKDGRSVKLTDLEESALLDLAREFRDNLLKKAGKSKKVKENNYEGYLSDDWAEILKDISITSHHNRSWKLPICTKYAGT